MPQAIKDHLALSPNRDSCRVGPMIRQRCCRGHRFGSLSCVVFAQPSSVTIEERKVTVTYTLTTPACPMNEYIDAEVVETLKERMPTLEAVIPKLSWEPLWDPSQMTEDAKLELGFF